jgi:uncharacterized protein (TIGR02246 family)
MKTLVLLITVFTTVAVYGQTTKSKSNKQMNLTEISNQILSRLENGWNNASGAEFAQPFADSCEFVTIKGELHRNSSPKYLADAHQGIFMSIYKGSRVDYQLLQAIQINNETILVNAKTELDAPTGPLAGKNYSTVTLILINSGRSWKIRSFHNTLVAQN